jgi:hypothetical protein
MILLKSLVYDPITVKTSKRALLLIFCAVARFCLSEMVILLENYSTGGGASAGHCAVGHCASAQELKCMEHNYS